MKKIAVYSFFESYNIGDILIAQRVKEIFSNYNCEFFNIVDGKPAEKCGLKKRDTNPKNTRKIKSKILKIPFLGDFIRMLSASKSRNYLNILKISQEFDIVVFAGGNIIMELSRFPTGIIQFYRTVKCLKQSGKKVCFLFAGMGPLKCKKSFGIAKKIFEMSDFISVRDEFSRQIVKKAMPEKEIELWCDPVLIARRENLNNEKSNSIGINVYFGNRNKEKQIKKAFVSLINRILIKYTDYNILLFSSELTDYENVRTVKNSFADNDRVKIEYADSPEELFSIYSRLDAVLALRMHTLITSIISGIPAVSISWQPKVSSLMDLLDNGDFNFSLESFISDIQPVFEALVSILENSDEIINKNFKTIEKLRAETISKTDKLISLLEG